MIFDMPNHGLACQKPWFLGVQTGVFDPIFVEKHCFWSKIGSENMKLGGVPPPKIMVGTIENHGWDHRKSWLDPSKIMKIGGVPPPIFMGPRVENPENSTVRGSKPGSETGQNRPKNGSGTPQKQVPGSKNRKTRSHQIGYRNPENGSKTGK